MHVRAPLIISEQGKKMKLGVPKFRLGNKSPNIKFRTYGCDTVLLSLSKIEKGSSQSGALLTERYVDISRLFTRLRILILFLTA